MRERWIPILGGRYRVSDQGRIIGRYGRVLKPYKNAKGYCRVTIMVTPSIKKTFLLSRLVCSAFHGPPPTAKHQADHENLMPPDNSAKNLRWLTNLDNHKTARHRKGEQHPRAILTETAVAAIIKSKLSSAAIAATYGVSARTIRDARSGETWKHLPRGEISP